MTVATSTTEAGLPARSVHVERAIKLLVGGALGGLSAALVCGVIWTLVYGLSGLVSALLAAAVVLFFYVLGQLVMVRFADAGARLLMAVSLASYSFRVLVLGVILVVYDRQRETMTMVEPLAVFWTIVAVVLGWLAVEIIVFTRLRITVFDAPYVAPTDLDRP